MNLLPIWKKDELNFNNCSCFPNIIRSIICGASSSGKTTFLLNLLINDCKKCKREYLQFDKLIFISPSLTNQTSYKIITKCFEEGFSKEAIRSIFRIQEKITDIDKLIKDLKNDPDLILKNKIEVQTYDDIEKLPEIKTLAIKNKRVVVIIDDSMLANNNNAKNLFVYGRPLNISSWYLSQNYSQIDKRSIRDNVNFFIFFKTSEQNLRHIYRNVASDIFSFDEFLKYVIFAG